MPSVDYYDDGELESRWKPTCVALINSTFVVCDSSSECGACYIDIQIECGVLFELECQQRLSCCGGWGIKCYYTYDTGK